MNRKSPSYKRKGSKNMPMTTAIGNEHWRHNRMIFYYGSNAYYDRVLHDHYWNWYLDGGSISRMDFWSWLKLHIPSGVRVVFDAVYDCNGLHFDNDSAKMLFVLLFGSTTSYSKESTICEFLEIQKIQHRHGIFVFNESMGAIQN